jgi:group I intron endonuclease
MKLKLKKNKICGIYKISNPNNECYIGQSFDIINRFKNHKKFICSNRDLSASLREYGENNHTFEILEECLPLQLLEREKHFIDFYKDKVTLFNFTIYTDIDRNKLFDLNKVRVLLFVDPKIVINLGKDHCQSIAKTAIKKEYKRFLKQVK